MAENPIEDYPTSLTDEQKNMLDDSPPEVAAHLLDYFNRKGYPPYFRLRARDRVTGASTGFIMFDGVDAVNGIDYLKYLVRRGYKDLPNAV